MKLLMIGIDAAYHEIFQFMPTPYIRNLMESLEDVPVVEDLWGRGWAKILGGVSAHEINAYYTRPDFNVPGCNSTQSFKVDGFLSAGVETLWERLNNNGYSVGFMNVPGTAPAPKVDGFFVSGAGAGLSTDGAISPHLYYPDTVRLSLEKNDYIFDTRFVASKIIDNEKFIRRLKLMAERRTDTYIALSKSHPVDVGFIAYMCTTRIQYLAMREIELMKKTDESEWTIFQKNIADLYKCFDSCVKKLVEHLNPENIMLVSDHGQSPYLYDIDLSVFLRDHGWLKNVSKTKSGLKDIARSIAKSLLPKSTLRKIKSNSTLVKNVSVSHSIDLPKTLAFSMRYVPGIYIKDERFGGSVLEVDEKNKLINDIIEAFNKLDQSKKFGLSARKYRCQYTDAKFNKSLPDIWIDHPDSMFFEFGVGQSRMGTGEFIQENKAYTQTVDCSVASRDQWTGIKGRYPILFAPKKMLNVNGEYKDLTAAYKIVTQFFN